MSIENEIIIEQLRRENAELAAQARLYQLIAEANSMELTVSLGQILSHDGKFKWDADLHDGRQIVAPKKIAFYSTAAEALAAALDEVKGSADNA